MNYRELYKEYYGVSITESYDIHHIDFNRSNNSIDNLILLPKELHAKYHRCINELGGQSGTTAIDFKINIQTDAQLCFIENYVETMKEIRKWVHYKHALDMQVMSRKGAF